MYGSSRAPRPRSIEGEYQSSPLPPMPTAQLEEEAREEEPAARVLRVGLAVGAVWTSTLTALAIPDIIVVWR